MKTLTYACVVFFAVVAAAVPSLLSAQTPAPSLAKELAATFQRAATEILDVAEVMPAEKYGYKPTPEISSFGDQLVHVAGITQRFIDTAKGTKTEAPHHGAMAKPEVIGLLKKTFQTRAGDDHAADRRPAPRAREVPVRRPDRHPRHVLAGPAVPDPQPLRSARGLSANERNRAADDRAAVGFASLSGLRTVSREAQRSPSRVMLTRRRLLPSAPNCDTALKGRRR